MAIVKKFKLPVDEITGTLGKIDRTLARNPGLSVTFKKSRHSATLSTKTLTPISRSEKFKARTALYCDCDTRYKALTDAEWHKKDSERVEYNKTNYPRIKTVYQFWMLLCLGSRYGTARYGISAYM